MKERLIFSWFECNANDVEKLENEMHHIVRTNLLGVGKMKNLIPKKDVMNSKQTPLFYKINWNANPELRDWLIEVNGNIP